MSSLYIKKKLFLKTFERVLDISNINKENDKTFKDTCLNFYVRL